MSDLHEVFERSELMRLQKDYQAMQELIASTSDPVLKKNLENDARQIASEIAKFDPSFIDRTFEDEAKKLNNKLHSN